MNKSKLKLYNLSYLHKADSYLTVLLEEIFLHTVTPGGKNIFKKNPLDKKLTRSFIEFGTKRLFKFLLLQKKRK